MNNLEDDKLQQLIEEGKLTKAEIDTNPSAKLYTSVFKALETTPDDALAPGFSNRVLQKIQAREDKSSWYDLLPIVLISAAFLLFLTIVLLILGTNLQFFNSLGQFKGYLFIGVIMILLIQLLDKKLVRT